MKLVIEINTNVSEDKAKKILVAFTKESVVDEMLAKEKLNYLIMIEDKVVGELVFEK